MLLLLIAPPALVAQAPAAAPQAFDQLQELLEAIPEALIDGKRIGRPCWRGAPWRLG